MQKTSFNFWLREATARGTLSRLMNETLSTAFPRNGCGSSA